MILTLLIWIAGVIAFLIVGTSIASAISALARQIGEGVKVKVDPLSLEAKLDKIELAKVDLTSLSEFPFHLVLDHQKIELAPLSVYPLHIALEGDDTRPPLRIPLGCAVLSAMPLQTDDPEPRAGENGGKEAERP